MTASAFDTKQVGNEGCPVVGSKKKGRGSLACSGEITQTHKRTTQSQKPLSQKKGGANVCSCFILNFQI